MRNRDRWAGFLTALLLLAAPSAKAYQVDFSGTWQAKASCPIGPVEFIVDLQGTEGTLVYEGLGTQKQYAARSPIKLTYFKSEMLVHFAGPDQGADLGSFQGTLLADGTIDDVRGLKIDGHYCQPFTLYKNNTENQRNAAPAFNVQGLSNAPLFIKIMQGRFAAISVPTDHPVFNSLYGSYLSAYAQHCAADANTRPKEFVEMTNLVCVEEGITATYYRNGTYTESAPYCTRWEDVPNGLYADPTMWKTKEKLDAVFLADTFKHIFDLGNRLDSSRQLDNAFKASPQKIFAAIATGVREMDTLVKTNGCDSPGLKRFEENLRLYALNRPFGIRPDGSSGPPIPIPPPGMNFEDPNYQTLLEDLLKEEARSWQVNKYVLDSMTSPTITSKDKQGRPLDVKANYRYGSLSGVQNGTMTLTFFEGYPECLYFSDKPKSCRSPNRKVVAGYVHGAYSRQNTPPEISQEQRLAQEKQQKEAASARQQLRRNLR